MSCESQRWRCTTCNTWPKFVRNAKMMSWESKGKCQPRFPGKIRVRDGKPEDTLFPRNLQQDPLNGPLSSSNLPRGPLVRSHSIFDGLLKGPLDGFLDSTLLDVPGVLPYISCCNLPPWHPTSASRVRRSRLFWHDVILPEKPSEKINGGLLEIWDIP